MTQETTHPDKPKLAVQRIYTKGSLFEAVTLTPALLKSISTTAAPTIDLQVQTNYTKREDDTYEAVLTINLTAKNDGSLLWRIQLQQAGLYTLEGVDEEQLKRVLNGYCMNQLYPYAATTASMMVLQGGFPPLYLTPMNFDTLYRKQLEQEAQTEGGERGTELAVAEDSSLVTH